MIGKKTVKPEKEYSKKNKAGFYTFEHGKGKIALDYENLNGYEEIKSLRCFKRVVDVDSYFHINFADIYKEPINTVYVSAKKICECKPALDILGMSSRKVMDSLDFWIPKYPSLT